MNINELYKQLLEAYKKHRQTVAFDDKNAYEIYKWQLITATQGKSPIEIVRAHVNNPNKSVNGGFGNLIDAIRDNTVLKDLVNNKPTEFEKALNKLVDETVPLNDRLSDFKTTMRELLQGTNFNSKANDERTVATILTCFNPQKYTLYKDSVYQKICAYLNVPTEKTGKKFQHYLELITPLAKLIEQDQELQTIVANSAIANLLQSNLLLAQDVCWELLVHFQVEKNCWLLIWNPQNWNWNNYEEWAKGTKNGNSYIENWTCISKQPQIGDQIFLMKLGAEPRGIIAHGVIEKPNYEAPHYDKNKAATGVTSPHVDVRFDDIRDYRTDPILSIETLNRLFPTQSWTPQSSGIQIKCNVNELYKIWKETQMNTKINSYINLLRSTHNLILTGAPGTGKTYLARQIADAMGAEVGFVQFHPSYDYTDFVEGLRPIKDDNGNVGFERKDGVFKVFCAKALITQSADSKITDELNPNPIVWKVSLAGTGNNPIRQDCMDNGYVRIGWSEYGNVEDFNDFDNWTNGGKYVLRYFQSEMKEGDIIVSCYSAKEVDAIGMVAGEYEYRENGGTYPRYRKVKWLVKNIRENIVDINGNRSFTLPTVYKSNITVADALKIVQKYNKTTTTPNRPFVFIIDEINRGEISKIFGELFFSIDPGYRGEKGRVQTQYQNIVEDGDIFKKGFFVPENVYIIGTMNDIDRSVESMDFAFRRRFAFKEIKADENVGMLDNLAQKDEAIKRMKNLNSAIEKVDGLSSAYHIGASYFLKLKDYNGDFDKLWEYHLEGLLREYLRGTQDVDKEIEKLKTAYNDESDHNNGQPQQAN